MKKLIALLTALSLLTPAFAVAQQGPDQGPGNLKPQVRAEMHADFKAEHASSTRAPGQQKFASTTPTPRLGSAIHNLASTTRAEWKGLASTTRAAARAKVDAIHLLIDQHKDAMRLRAEAAKEKAYAHFGEHVEKLVGTIADRLASTSQKLDELADRADIRIEELKDQGFTMASSTTWLEKSKSDLALANQKITEVNTALEAAMSVGTSTAKGEMPAVRAAVIAAQGALELVKTDLRATLNAIKVESAATSSATI